MKVRKLTVKAMSYMLKTYDTEKKEVIEELFETFDLDLCRPKDVSRFEARTGRKLLEIISKKERTYVATINLETLCKYANKLEEKIEEKESEV